MGHNTNEFENEYLLQMRSRIYTAKAEITFVLLLLKFSHSNNNHNWLNVVLKNGT